MKYDINDKVVTIFTLQGIFCVLLHIAFICQFLHTIITLLFLFRQILKVTPSTIGHVTCHSKAFFIVDDNERYLYSTKKSSRKNLIFVLITNKVILNYYASKQCKTILLIAEESFSNVSILAFYLFCKIKFNDVQPYFITLFQYIFHVIAQ